MFESIFTTLEETATPLATNEQAAELYNLKQQIKELTKKADQITESLKFVAQNKTTTFGDYILLLKNRRGNIVYSQIPELFDIDLDQYRGPDIQYFELHKA